MCFSLPDTIDHPATSLSEREIFAVGANDGQLREEVPRRF